MRSRFLIGIVILLVLLLAAYFGWQVFHPAIVPSIAGQSSGEKVIDTPLSKSYTNTAHSFSLMMPDGYSAHEVPPDENGASTVVIQNSASDGIQIRIQPFQGDVKVLTADMIKADIPDMTINDPQAVNIGADYQGVAFKSDNDAFDGDSREVWFVFRGTLYQISTYARLDPLLKGIFSTWKFF